MRTGGPSGVQGSEAGTSRRASGGSDAFASDFRPQDWERRHSCCPKLPSWWALVTAAAGDSCRPLTARPLGEAVGLLTLTTPPASGRLSDCQGELELLPGTSPGWPQEG